MFFLVRSAHLHVLLERTLLIALLRKDDAINQLREAHWQIQLICIGDCFFLFLVRSAHLHVLLERIVFIALLRKDDAIN